MIMAGVFHDAEYYYTDYSKIHHTTVNNPAFFHMKLFITR